MPAVLDEWEPVIGLEIHVQLATASKAFSPSGVAFGAPPNSLTDPLVLGLPGTLPVFNRRALELAVRLGVATSSKIRARSRFARKHYFYPDLPKGYQISQYDEPLCEDGAIDVLVGTRRMAIRLQRIHLEEDAGKSSHEGATSHLDLNRAGVPLVEVVTAPELASAEEAAELMRSIHRLVRWLEISEADMEKGQLRCDANVSVRRRGEDRLGTRTELKNINSFRFVQKAIEHEILRQIRILETGGRILRETRLWDAMGGVSFPMRSKEEANDYRYFPDPDLPPLVVDAQIMGAVLGTLPELPGPRFERYQRELGVSPDDARTLVSERPLAEYFEAAVAARRPEAAVGVRGRAVANWLLTELLGALNGDDKAIGDSPLSPASLAELVDLIEDGTISGKIGKDVFESCYASGQSPAAYVESKGLRQISNEAELLKIIEQVLVTCAKQAADYRAGKEGLFGFFVGQVMKATGGRANPQLTSELMLRALKS
ncbi:MAG: Asp-tRNA(Asn)/Glu-tRNA(Gln) amidotransferase subunit GatB [Myxococcales bacterium]|nr:Asp-tRNA(Asn)/Glu-tRNA(Gln) amidotransferase subunit GatB [Myxococcales bacterium]